MTYKDENKGIYSGNWKDDKKNGWGKQTYIQCGNCGYYGEWKDDKKNGKGFIISKHVFNTTVDKDGNKVDILEPEDIIKQVGIMKAKDAYNDYLYDLNWVQHVKEGTIVEHEHTIFGVWENDEITKGKINYPNKNVYEGDFITKGHGFDLYALPNGNGKMTYNSGFNEGDIYDGNWKLGKKDGEGKKEYANGKKYEGHWENDHINGKGKMTYDNGDIYEGDWKHSEKHGNGKMTYANGDIYEGNWFNDIREGEGEMTYANGEVYNGHWYNKRNGKGKLKDKTGKTIFSGIWKDDSYDYTNTAISKINSVRESVFSRGSVVKCPSGGRKTKKRRKNNSKKVSRK